MSSQVAGISRSPPRADLHRRWPNKQELVRAALAHQARKEAVLVPDTGSLRDDIIALLREANRVRVGLWRCC